MGHKAHNEVSKALYSRWDAQCDAAKELKVSQPAISRMMARGEVSPDLLPVFVRKTGWPPERLSSTYRKMVKLYLKLNGKENDAQDDAGEA